MARRSRSSINTGCTCMSYRAQGQQMCDFATVTMVGEEQCTQLLLGYDPLTV